MSSTPKAPRVTLGKRPQSFTKTVSGPMADGTVGEMSVTFRHRTRTEWGALLDQHKNDKSTRAEAALQSYLDAVQAARQAGESTLPMPPGAEAAQTADVEADARLLLDIASGWDLPDPFTFDNVKQLADEAPGMVAAIVRSYGEAVHEGRLGN